MTFRNILFIHSGIFFISLCVGNTTIASDKQIIMGAGPSTVVATLFFKHFSKMSVSKGYLFEVEQRSIKHAGGIKAAEKYYFGRTGRILNEQEKAKNKRDIILAGIPIAIVVGNKVGVEKISIEQLENIMTGKISRWSQLGGVEQDIVLVGRENTEAVFSVLKKQYPFFTQAKFNAVLKRDHQVVNLLKTSNGDYVISFGAESNFKSSSRLNVTGFSAGVSLGLVYDLSNQKHLLVNAAIKYAQSDEWAEILRRNKFLLPQH